ncbi:hypothetical protein MC885_018933 [Smutsia gigantea]|nr:hypothetical protein MC885_018933 [Smutsia gigantea]
MDYYSRHAAPQCRGPHVPQAGAGLLAWLIRRGLSRTGRQGRVYQGRGPPQVCQKEWWRPWQRRMEAVVFVFSLLDCCALIFLSVYFIITLSDLECDYINARSCCSKLNKWIIPELIGHTIVTVLMLVSLHWFIFLLNLPVATWNIYR